MLTGWQRPGVPLADSLATAVREAVLDGRFRVGDHLPSERSLAAQLGVSRGTVVAALARLRSEGWLTTRAGSASTVRLPSRLGERYAPASLDRADPVDLRHAVPAAPREIYTAAAQRALGRSARLLLESGEPDAGLPELRELIAARHTAEGRPTRPDQILITSGARAAMTLLITHLAPRRAVVENPAFHGTLALLRRSGTRMAPVRVTASGWDPGQLARAFGEAAGHLACLIPDFHNPTGALMDRETRRLIAGLAETHRVTVICDETMRDLDLRDTPSPEPRIPGSVTVGSMSKSVWGGLRTGWIRAPAALIRELLLDPMSGVCAPPPMEQLLACELFPHLDALLNRRRAELRTQRDHLAARLREHEDWTFTLPEGGLTLWLRTRTDTLVQQAALAGLDLLPGPAFSPNGTLTHWLRLPYTAPPATLDRAVDRLTSPVA
ncbi:PLP-dependent aminotransferase family protein [Nonomuraea typhae]|uniref:aminotransferase-like domain-containing protein n=1 Tax=Nonomuraea typhae TaxID=2603600 RepID=UPI0012F823DC|nr:PLP-dependent aminotransferase family protein [Nonomuraea typhae]